MEANEFVGFTLPVVNEGPWSYFSNGVPENGEDGEEETMIVEGVFGADGSFTIDETSKTIFDAIASGKTVIVKYEVTVDGTGETVIGYSIIIETNLVNDEYNFILSVDGEMITVIGVADENPTNATEIS